MVPLRVLLHREEGREGAMHPLCPFALTNLSTILQRCHHVKIAYLKDPHHYRSVKGRV